jgi:hypothetical protein
MVKKMNTEISRLVEFDDAIETARNAHDLYDLDVIVVPVSDLWAVEELRGGGQVDSNSTSRSY